MASDEQATADRHEQHEPELAADRHADSHARDPAPPAPPLIAAAPHFIPRRYQNLAILKTRLTGRRAVCQTCKQTDKEISRKTRPGQPALGLPFFSMAPTR
jgi:hypothetical protein